MNGITSRDNKFVETAMSAVETGDANAAKKQKRKEKRAASKQRQRKKRNTNDKDKLLQI